MRAVGCPRDGFTSRVKKVHLQQMEAAVVKQPMPPFHVSDNAEASTVRMVGQHEPEPATR